MSSSDWIDTAAERGEPLNAERLLGLRSFAGFEDVDLEDAALILGAMTERTLAPGTQLSKRGAPLSAAWFVIDGELAANGAAEHRLVHAGETVGMLELLSNTSDGLDLECTREAIVLELEKADFMAMLAGNFEMLADAMRSLSRAILHLAPLEAGPMSPIEPLRAKPLQLVDSLLLLHELSPFGAVGAETMTEFAATLTELTVAGTVEHRGEIAERIYLVLNGRLRYGSLEIPPGNGFGALQSLAESPLAHDLVADDHTRVLMWSLDTIMDALDDDIPFALTWLQQMAARAHHLAAGAMHYPVQEIRKP